MLCVSSATRARPTERARSCSCTAWTATALHTGEQRTHLGHSLRARHPRSRVPRSHRWITPAAFAPSLPARTRTCMHSPVLGPLCSKPRSLRSSGGWRSSLIASAACSRRPAYACCSDPSSEPATTLGAFDCFNWTPPTPGRAMAPVPGSPDSFGYLESNARISTETCSSGAGIYSTRIRRVSWIRRARQ